MAHRLPAVPLLVILLAMAGPASPARSAPLRLLVWCQGPPNARDRAALATAGALPGVHCVALDPQSPLVQRPVTDGTLPRDLLPPRDAPSAAALARALDADLILLPNGLGLHPDGDPELVESGTAAARVGPHGGTKALCQWLAKAVPELGSVHPGAGGLGRVGLAWLGRNRPKEAAIYLSQAAALEPSDASCWRHLAEAYLRDGRTHGAQQAIKQAQSLQPHDPAVLLAAAQIEGSAGRPVAALSLAGQVARLPGLSQPIHQQLGDFYLNQGLRVRADGEYRAALGVPALSPGESAGKRALEWLEALRRAMDGDQTLATTFPMLDFGWQQALSAILKAGLEVARGGGVREDFDRALAVSLRLVEQLRAGTAATTAGPRHVLVYALIAQAASGCRAALRDPNGAGLNDALRLLSDTCAELEHARRSTAP